MTEAKWKGNALFECNFCMNLLFIKFYLFRYINLYLKIVIYSFANLALFIKNKIIIFFIFFK